MQTIPKTTPNKDATKKIPNTLSQTGLAKVNVPSKLKHNEDNKLTRLLAACCDCV